MCWGESPRQFIDGPNSQFGKAGTAHPDAVDDQTSLKITIHDHIDYV
jgi:hypothetical protein